MRKKTGLGQKKELDAQLNLTPFIDLLSTMVCFLLITAVWIDIGTVEVKQSHGTDAKESKKESFDLDLVFKNSTAMRLNLKRNGRTIKRYDVKAENFEDALIELNTTIAKKVLSYKNKAIDIAAATITPRSGVNYGNLISTLDILRKNQIINIGVLSARGQ